MGTIKIIHRDEIKVFYSRVENAKADNYHDFDPSVFTRKNGYLYSFTGLRGDARALYKSIKSG